MEKRFINLPTHWDNMPMNAWLQMSDEEVREAMLVIYGTAPSLEEMKRPGEAHTLVPKCPACGQALPNARAAIRARHRGGCLACKPDQRKRRAA